MKEIGKIVSVHGVEGDMVISHIISAQRSAQSLTVLMIEVWERSYIPFFIEYIKGVSNDDMVLKFEEINSREEAKKFLNKKVYVFDEKSLQTNSEEEWGYLTGYSIIDQHGNKVGQAEKIISHGIQMFIEMNYKGKAIHLPLHADLVKSVDQKKKLLTLEIAEGLLELWD